MALKTYVPSLFYSQKQANHSQLEALSLGRKDNENVRHYALKNETLVKQG